MSPDEALASLPLSVPVYDPALICPELTAICCSSVFADSEPLCAFLTFVVNAYLEGNTTGLKETVIGFEVYRRESGYNPKTDAIVRTETRRLRQKLDEYYAGEGLQSTIVIRLPKGGTCRKLNGALHRMETPPPFYPQWM